MHNELILLQTLSKSVQWSISSPPSHWTPKDTLSLKIYCKIHRVSRSGILCWAGCRLQIPCALGLPRGKRRSLHSTFLMGCNQEHVCFKPISELPALNPNSFLKRFLLNLNIKYASFCWQRYTRHSFWWALSPVLRQTVRVSAACKRKETRGHATFSFPFTTCFPPLFFFFFPIFCNLYKITGWDVCLILDLKQRDNSELEKPALIFG